VVEGELRAEDMTAEPAEPAGIVALDQARALLEEVGDLRQGQDDDDQGAENDGAERGDQDDAPALRPEPR
jgi:hypothetical protein